MTNISRSIVFLCFLVSSVAMGAYERNQAVAVEKVTYGEVVSVRQISQEELRQDQHSGWKTFGGALLGGLIGNQFGDGSGRDVATVLGAIAGAGVARNRTGQPYVVEHQLVEMMIRLEQEGGQVMILQDRDPNMRFNAGNLVRVVYLQGGDVRVDLAR